MDLYTRLKKYTEYSMGKSKEVQELIYQDTSFDGIVFTGYDLNNSWFLEVVFNSCDFSKVYLSGASLCGSTFRSCEFLENTFKKGNADYSIFESTILNGMDAFRTTFYESQFSNVKFLSAKLSKVYMDESRFSEVVFENTEFISTSFNKSTFENVRFINCYFEECKFEQISGFNEITFVNSNITIGGELREALTDKEMKELL